MPTGFPPPFPEQQNNPFRLRSLPEPLADHNPLHYLNKSGHPKREMIDSVKLLCELAKESPLSRKALYRRANVSGSSAIKYCDQLARLNIIRVKDIRRNFITRLHYITLAGKVHLFTVTELNIEEFGLNRRLLLKDIIKDISASQEDALLRFVKKFLTALATANKRDILQRWADETARELFWLVEDEEDLDSQPVAVLESSWFWMIPSLTLDEVVSYLRTIDEIRPSLDKEEAERAHYRLRNLYHKNPDYFDEFMPKLSLPELTAWISH